MVKEILHHMKSKKSKKGNLIFKLDLEKAYDTVHWNFLYDTLNMFGFPHGLILLIMHSISSSSVFVVEWE